MAKTKRKSNLSNTTIEKKSKTAKLNPFEIRFNREKHSVINRKKKNSSSKNEAVGRPGMARSRAIQKRKETLLQEYKIRNKSNVFIDKRIGEKDAELSAEDKMIARFTMERMKTSGKKSIFNLGQEENLTHYGQSISQIEQFDDDPRSDDEEFDKTNKKLSAEMNFGGFMSQNDLEFSQGKGNSRKEWIEQMITESKQRKFELQKDKEEALKMTQDLDQQWKNISYNLKVTGAFYTKKFTEENEDEKNNDDYDKLMKELVFEPKKAKAQDRLKTDEEIVKEQKDMLEKLEDLRQKRMKGEDLEQDSDEEGNANEEDGNEEEVGDEEEDEGSDEEDDEDENDKYSDLEESEDENEPKKNDPKMDPKKESIESKPAKNEGNEKKEIPFTFAVPKTSEALDELLEERSPKEKAIIIERMIKCNHPQFGNDNKAQLENLFTFLLQHIHDCANDSFESVELLVPFLFDLAKFSPQPSGEAIRSVLQEKYDEYCKTPRIYPNLDSLVFLKITTLLFPTSDYRHPVATPALQWMSQMLCSCRPFSKKAITSGLFVASIMCESLSLSKKYSPELINFLSGIVFMAVPKDDQTVIPFVPPFKVVGSESTLLADLLTKKKVQPSKLKYQDCNSLTEQDITEEFAATALKTSLDLILYLVGLWSDHPSAPEIFKKLQSELLPQLPKERMHKELVELAHKLSEEISEKVSNQVIRSHMIPERKKEIKILKLYDPELDDNFDPFVKKRKLTKEKQELAKMNHKIKREQKGARKDLRADTAFLARQKAKDQREKDADRMRKTKAILGGLGAQEGEYRQFQRQKKKKK